MNYGEKLIKLKDSTSIKHWTKYGETIGVPGEWLAEQAKKDSVQTIDISRLVKIVEYHNISLDYLFRNDDRESPVNKNDNLEDDDIFVMIENIQIKLQDKNVKFNGYTMSNDCKDIASDGLEVLKSLIKSNL